MSRRMYGALQIARRHPVLFSRLDHSPIHAPDPKGAPMHPPAAVLTPLQATSPAAIEWCACFAGMCRCEVVGGRTLTGAHCKAHAAGSLLEDCA